MYFYVVGIIYNVVVVVVVVYVADVVVNIHNILNNIVYALYIQCLNGRETENGSTMMSRKYR